MMVIVRVVLWLLSKKLIKVCIMAADLMVCSSCSSRESSDGGLSREGVVGLSSIFRTF